MNKRKTLIEFVVKDFIVTVQPIREQKVHRWEEPPETIRSTQEADR